MDELLQWFRSIEEQGKATAKRSLVEAREYMELTDLEIAEHIFSRYQQGCPYKEGCPEQIRFKRDWLFWKNMVDLLREEDDAVDPL